MVCLTCCGEDADENSARIQKKHKKIFKSTNERSCSDIICLLMWLVYMIVLIVIMVYSMLNGNLSYIQYPVDYLDQFCGSSPGVVDRPRIFFPRLDQDIAESLPLLATGIGILSFRPYGLCVASCPQVFSLQNPTPYGGPTYPGAAGTPAGANATAAPDTSQVYYNTRGTQQVVNYCLPTTRSLPAETRRLCGVPNCTDPVLNASLGGTLSCTTIDATPEVTSAWEVQNDAQAALCEFVVVERTAATFVPEDYNDDTGPYEQTFASFVTGAQEFYHEVWEYRTQAGVMGFGAPFAIGFVWFILLFFFAGLLIAIALIVGLLALLAGCFYLYAKAGLFDVNDFFEGNATAPIDVNFSQDEDNRTVYIVFSVLCTIALLLYLLFLISARNNVYRCIKIVEETTKVFYSIPVLAAYPLIPVGFSILLVLYTIVISAFIWTGEQDSWAHTHALIAGLNSSVGDDFLSELGTVSAQNRRLVLIAVHLIGCIWLWFFIKACAYATYAGVAARWFFSHEDGALSVKFFCGWGTCLDSAWCVFSKHLGTMAFGSAIMTIITVIRLICEYIDRKTKDLQDKQLIIRLVMKCVKCCLACLYYTIQWMTQYAYIFTAIKGSGFCSSGRQTFGLMGSYPTQVVVNRMVGGILEILIEFSIPAVCALLGFIWCDAAGSSNPVWPALFIFLVAFTISSGIGDVFRCTIDTVFLCAFEDMEEAKKKNEKPYYMSKQLQKSFDIHYEASNKVNPEEVQLTKAPGGSTNPFAARGGGSSITSDTGGGFTASM